MTEEQELALALQMSLQGAGMTGLLEQAMETDSGTVAVDGAGDTEVGLSPFFVVEQCVCVCVCVCVCFV